MSQRSASLCFALIALICSGAMSGAAGAAYALLFGYAGATFASIQYSILPLLWVLLGGAGTVLGPLLGTGAMFYLVDVASSFTDAYLLVVGDREMESGTVAVRTRGGKDLGSLELETLARGLNEEIASRGRTILEG